MHAQARRLDARRARIGVRALHVLLASLLVLFAAFGRAPARGAAVADSLGATGVPVTVAATSEQPDPSQSPPFAGALVLQLTLDNQSGGDVTGLSVQSPIPAQTL